MTTSDKLREFGQKVIREYGRWWGIEEKDTDKFLSDLTALISEHYYPKEFLLWTHHQDYWHFDIITDMWYSDDDPQLLHEITTDELFDYWTNNVKQ